MPRRSGLTRAGRTGRAATVLASALLAAACTTDIAGQPGVAGAVVTYRAPGVGFGGFATVARAGRVGLVTDADPGKVFANAPTLLAALDSHLAARGFVKVAEPDPASPPPAPPAADLVVNVTALAVAGAGATYWNGFAGYSQPPNLGFAGYAWSYPWPWLSVTSLPGTLLVEISDARGASAGQMVVVWAALAYGVAPAGDWDGPPVLAALDQAFAQSPYLMTP
ncbi:MAG TPA: hypothetical protein VFR85_01695 [Anaeromyxobacteraceae bacterium]|nr:hypothetical protein [Anaeromyxobacteraceae bacterium]